MFKVIFLVKRRPDWSFAQYQRYSDETHVHLVCQLPGIRRYVVNYASAADGQEAPPHDGVIELGFDDAAAFQHALQSKQGQQALADQSNFLDTAATQMLPVTETVWV